MEIRKILSRFLRMWVIWCEVDENARDLKKGALVPYQEYLHIWFHGLQVLKICVLTNAILSKKTSEQTSAQHTMTSTA